MMGRAQPPSTFSGPESVAYALGHGEDEQARVQFHIDRLEELGPLLDEPHTRQQDAAPGAARSAAGTRGHAAVHG